MWKTSRLNDRDNPSVLEYSKPWRIFLRVEIFVKTMERILMQILYLRCIWNWFDFLLYFNYILGNITGRQKRVENCFMYQLLSNIVKSTLNILCIFFILYSFSRNNPDRFIEKNKFYNVFKVVDKTCRCQGVRGSLDNGIFFNGVIRYSARKEKKFNNRCSSSVRGREEYFTRIFSSRD